VHSLSLPLQVIALLVAGAASGFINVVAGGGSLITLPLLIFLGLPETTANGTSRLAIIVQSVTATLAFKRAGQLDMELVGQLAPPALIGAVIGALVGVRLSDAGFRTLLGIVMLGCAVLVVLRPGSGATGAAPKLTPQRVWPVLFAIGLYGGLVQAGVGYLILAGLTIVLGLGLQPANVLKTVLVAVYTPLAFLVFLWNGQIDLWSGAILSVGSALGGFIGVSVSLKRGEKWIRAMLALVVLASGLKLLLSR
jgi:hypothetical protein